VLICKKKNVWLAKFHQKQFTWLCWFICFWHKC